MKGSSNLLKANISFVRYGTRHGKDQSGSYLFLPDGEAQVFRASEIFVFWLVLNLIYKLPKEETAILTSMMLQGSADPFDKFCLVAIN